MVFLGSGEIGGNRRNSLKMGKRITNYFKFKTYVKITICQKNNLITREYTRIYSKVNVNVFLKLNITRINYSIFNLS